MEERTCGKQLYKRNIIHKIFKNINLRIDSLKKKKYIMRMAETPNMCFIEDLVYNKDHHKIATQRNR